MAAAAAIAGGAGIGSGLLAAKANSEARADAKRTYEQSVQDLTNIGIPSIEAQQLVMQKYQSAGQWTPELEQSVKLGDTNLSGISTDPQYQTAQLNALNKLSEIGSSGGQTLTDKANLEKTLGGIDADQRGRREAILQGAQSRGGYGSGQSLVAQLMAQQEGGQAARQAGLSSQATAQDRALQAIQGAGTLGTNLRDQAYNEKAKAASAQDQINQWNAQNSQAVGNTNVGTANSAAQYNLTNAQNLSNSNTDIANKQETYNKGLQQQNFTNQLNIAQAKANARAGQASNAIQGGKDTAAIWQGVGSGVGQAATAAGQASNEEDAKQRKAAAPVTTY